MKNSRELQEKIKVVKRKADHDLIDDGQATIRRKKTGASKRQQSSRKQDSIQGQNE